MALMHKPSPVEREWKQLRKKEQALAAAASKAVNPRWKEELNKKVPGKVLAGLEAAFSTGFSMVFRKGTKLLEKTYDPQTLRQEHAQLDARVAYSGSRRELRRLRNGSGKAQLGNLAIATVEGVGLGALGVGMPDIVLFLGMLLKGVYETALRYGFEYDTPREQLLILKMMETSMRRGEDWRSCNAEVEELLRVYTVPDEQTLNEQIRRTGEAFAMEMLLVKFVQGLPLVGTLGGAANPVYYNKVMRYVQLKYFKRYLLKTAQAQGIRLR